MLKKFDNYNLLKKQYISLEKNDIHVWIINWKQVKEYILSKLNYLPEEEISEVKKYKMKDDKMRTLSGRILLIDLLESYTNLPYYEFKIKRGKYGKPYIKTNLKENSIQFNVSHSKNIVMIAFCKCKRLGVDIESIRHVKDYKELAKNFYSVEEFEKVESEIDFLQFWTKKEAYLKALGMGLNKDLSSFIILGYRILDEGHILNNWYVIDVKIKEKYIASIVVNI